MYWIHIEKLQIIVQYISNIYILNTYIEHIEHIEHILDIFDFLDILDMILISVLLKILPKIEC